MALMIAPVTFVNAQVQTTTAVPSPGTPSTGTQSQASNLISLADAIKMGLSKSNLALASTAKIAAAAAQLHKDGSPVNPTLQLSQHVGDGTGGLDEDVLLSTTFELGDKQRQRVHASRGLHDAAISDGKATANDIVFAVQSAYFGVLTANVELEQAQEAVANAQAFATAADIQLKAGDVPRSNVVRSKVELARQKQALAVVETERTNRYDALVSLLGLPGKVSNVVLTDTLTYKPENFVLNALQLQAAAHRPDIQSAKKNRDARDAAVHGARVASAPDLVVEARKFRVDLDERGQSLRVGLQFPIVDFGRNRADVDIAKSALKEQDFVVKETIRVAELDVRTAFRNWEQAKLAVASFVGDRLDNARELLTMAQTGYQQGANTYLELLDAQSAYHSEQVEYARALSAYQITRASLQKAVGGTLP